MIQSEVGKAIGWPGGGLQHERSRGPCSTSRSGVNLWFWSYLDNSGQTPFYLEVMISFKSLREEIQKKYI